MRLLHTSDWHLGHTLGGLTRRFEHQRFFSWLRDVCVDQQIDAIVIAGDVFDSANPPATAFEDFYGLLADLHSALPKLDMVVVGGNHDSPARLEAPHPLLKSLRIHVVGSLPRQEPDSLGHSPVDVSRIVVPLHDRAGNVAVWCVAIPYVRPADLATRWLGSLAPGDDAIDPLVEGVREVYSSAVKYARSIRRAGQAMIATGHCYMANSKLSEFSERKILGGNLHALPVDLVSDEVSYLALGHLHLAQTVGNSPTRRYCGAPIPLHADEADYPHQVVVVEFEGEHTQNITPFRVPRSVEFIRVPKVGAGTFDEVVAELRQLPQNTSYLEPTHWPYLDVRVRLSGPMPDLRSRIEAELTDKACRLLKITTETSGLQTALSDTVTNTTLAELDPEIVFLKLHESRYGNPPKPAILQAFRELLSRITESEPMT